MNFPEHFFEKEIRWDFEISEMMKRAWAAELELVEIIENICSRHDLHYFATGGTLLGAIRHKGFIPWDDDIDLTMLRADYNKLIKCLHNELPDGIVIAGMHSPVERLQKASLCPHLRIIADEEYWSFPEYLNRFHGFPYPRIGIDIFPMDYISTDDDLLDFQLSAYYALNFTVQNFELYIKENQMTSQLQYLEKMCHVTFDRNKYLPTQLLQTLDQIAQMADPSTSTKLTNMQYSAGSTQRPLYGRQDSWYTETLVVPFEHTQMRIPKGYEHILSHDFGDYMKPVKFTSDHEYPFYKKQEKELRRMFDEAGIDTDIETFCHNWMIAAGRS